MRTSVHMVVDSLGSFSQASVVPWRLAQRFFTSFSVFLMPSVNHLYVLASSSCDLVGIIQATVTKSKGLPTPFKQNEDAADTERHVGFRCTVSRFALSLL